MAKLNEPTSLPNGIKAEEDSFIGIQIKTMKNKTANYFPI